MKAPDTITWLLLGLAVFLLWDDGNGGILAPAQGPRHVLIVREADNQTPELSELTVQLRRGPAADALKAAGHQLDIYDDDDKGGSDKPIPLLEKFTPWLPHGEMVILQPPDKLLYRGPIPATADAVVAKVKEHGG